MSWIFGRKKHKESPTESNEEESTSNQQDDDYVVIEKRDPNPYPPISIAPSVPSPSGSGGIYPYLAGGFGPKKPAPPIPTQQNTLGDNGNFLSGVPFQLNKMLENTTEIDQIHVDGILSFVTKVQNEDYSYDFGLEQSVISEMEAAF